MSSKKLRWILVAAVSLSLLLWSNLVFANPVYSSSQCIPASWAGPDDWWDERDTGTTANEIHYYIEYDFAFELAACTANPTDDSELAERHVRGVIKDAAEIWNTQTRGMALKYGGWVDREIYAAACDDRMHDRPGVFVNFKDYCRVDTFGNCVNGTVARVMNDDDNDCDKTATLMVFGDTNTPNNPFTDPDEVDGGNIDCDNSNGGVIEWDMSVNAVSNSSDLMSTLVHEFGHVLNLGDNPTAPTNSIMNNGNVTNPNRRHLYYWEKDCVDENQNARDLDYNWLGFDANGTQYPPGVQSRYTSRTDQGMLSGGWWRGESSGHSYYFGQYHSKYDYIRYGEQFADGSVYFPTLDYVPTTMLTDETPVYYTPDEKDPSGENLQRISYLFEGSSGTIDPPRIRYFRSGDFFQNSLVTGSYRDGNFNYLFSHIPLVSAYDPYTSTTIFARVETGRNAGADQGKIFLYPGFKNGSEFQLNSAGIEVNVNLPSDPYSQWDYLGETDFAPGLACAWEFTLEGGQPYEYNCLLAWQDRGIPDGRILYTYFKVDSFNDDIDFHGDVWVRAQTEAIGHISAASFAEDVNGNSKPVFYIGYKDWHKPTNITYTKNDTFGTYPGFSGLEETERRRAVGAPTWMYSPWTAYDEERALMWTENY